MASGRGGFLQDSRLGRAHTRMPRTLARKPVGAFSARQNCSITPLNWVRARHHELDGCFNRHFSGLVLGPTRSAQRAAASLTFLHRQDSALICRARGTIFACLYSFGYACETSRLRGNSCYHSNLSRRLPLHLWSAGLGILPAHAARTVSKPRRSGV